MKPGDTTSHDRGTGLRAQATTLTPAQREARQQGRLDQRCRDCGATSAASSWCCGCGGRDLEYREHLPGPKPGEHGPRPVQWCQQDNSPKVVDPVRRARALAAREVAAQSEKPADVIPGGDGARQQRLAL